MGKQKQDQLIERKRLLEEFDMVTVGDIARLLNIDVKTLKNRPRSQRPAFSKVGNEQISTRQQVRDFFAAKTVQADTTLRRDKPQRGKRLSARKAERRPSA